MTDYGIDSETYANGMEVEGYSISTSMDEWFEQNVEEKIREAYQLGLLHGINASSMARTKNDVMEFEDYEWHNKNEPL